MGEYATYAGQEIKIGTCENMLYLRADQRGLVGRLPGNVDPLDESALAHLRFRFPWPDEDRDKPGAYESAFRHLGISLAFSQPLDFDHGSVQFVASVGMLCSLPCPLGPDARKDIAVIKNGWSGDVLLTQTAYRNGEWRVICQCGACRHAFSLPLWAAEELAVSIRAHADRLERAARAAGHTDGAVAWHHTVADRVLAGYQKQGATP